MLLLIVVVVVVVVVIIENLHACPPTFACAVRRLAAFQQLVCSSYFNIFISIFK